MPADEEKSGSESVDPNRDIFDRDDFYASDDSDDSDDELSDQFRMGHYMDHLLSDSYIPDDGVDKECSDKLRSQLIEFLD